MKRFNSLLSENVLEDGRVGWVKVWVVWFVVISSKDYPWYLHVLTIVEGCIEEFMKENPFRWWGSGDLVTE